jgi:hypothetical protein
MIKQEIKIIEAKCDACGESLSFKDGSFNYLNYATLKHSFGFGSPLDDTPGPSYDLCELCWKKAMKALGTWRKYVHEYHDGMEPKLEV